MRFLVWGGLCLFSGLLYYAAFRLGSEPFTDVSRGSYPSFIFVLAFSLFSAAVGRGSGWFRLLPALGWLGLVLATEPFFGTADRLDAIAAIAGFSVALGVLVATAEGIPTRSWAATRSVGIAISGVVLLGGSFLPPFFDDGSSTTPYRHYCDDERCAAPVYMSYSELRSAVRMEAPRAMKKLGRLYIYGDRIFMSDAGQGVHLINNDDPANPVAIGFINIPGNTNMGIRDGFLYVDSFIDLVVLDVRDPANIFEVARQIDVFPYDAFQAINFDGHLTSVNQDKGVVIDYAR